MGGTRGLVLLALCAVALGALCASASAAPGGLDPSFNGDGKARTNPTAGEDWLSGAAQQANGAIVVAGGASPRGVSRFAVARYRTDGRLAQSFGGDGLVLTSVPEAGGGAKEVALQDDGKIVVVGGFSAMAIARFNADGTLDSTFSDDGKTSTLFFPLDMASGSDVAIQPDGKIVVVGTAWCDESFSQPGSCTAEEDSRDIAIARYETDGTLDETFGGGDGLVVSERTGVDDFGHAVALDTDGNIVVGGDLGSGGRVGIVQRYDSTGTLDATFDSTQTDLVEVSDLVIQPDGKILVSGQRGGIWGLGRYETTGTPDATFGEGDGFVAMNLGAGSERANAVALQLSGKIVAAGYAGTRFALARHEADGTLDDTFSADGLVFTNFNRYAERANGLVVQANQRIVVVGQASGPRTGRDENNLERDSSFALARYGGG